MVGPSLVLALTLSASIPLAQGPSLSAAAAASGRPAECSSRSKRALAKGPSVWELARFPTLQTYCDRIARAHAELPTMPDAARKAAEEADKALPGHAAPAIVMARAALALGDPARAAKEFARARAIDPRSVEDAATMHDLGRVLRRTGKREEALGIYRALVPRVDLLAGADRRARVLLEAAHLSMEVEGDGGAVPTLGALSTATARATPAPTKAKPTLDEAVAYLREARQRPPTELSSEVLLSLALVLDRAGSREEANVVLLEAIPAGTERAPAGKPGAPARAEPRFRADALDYLNRPEERTAIEALSLEPIDRAAAAKAWEAYLAGPGGKGPWATSARARLEGLRRGSPAPSGARRSGAKGKPSP